MLPHRTSGPCFSSVHTSASTCSVLPRPCREEGKRGRERVEARCRANSGSQVPGAAAAAATTHPTKPGPRLVRGNAGPAARSPSHPQGCSRACRGRAAPWWCRRGSARLPPAQAQGEERRKAGVGGGMEAGTRHSKQPHAGLVQEENAFRLWGGTMSRQARSGQTREEGWKQEPAATPRKPSTHAWWGRRWRAMKGSTTTGLTRRPGASCPPPPAHCAAFNTTAPARSEPREFSSCAQQSRAKAAKARGGGLEAMGRLANCLMHPTPGAPPSASGSCNALGAAATVAATAPAAPPRPPPPRPPGFRKAPPTPPAAPPADAKKRALGAASSAAATASALGLRKASPLLESRSGGRGE